MANQPARQNRASRGAARRDSVVGHGVLNESNRESVRDTDPHLPVLHHVQPAVEASDRFVDIAANYDGWSLNSLRDDDLVQKPVDDSGARSFPAGAPFDRTGLIDIEGFAEKRARTRIRIERSAHRFIKSGMDPVVAVQLMHEEAARRHQAGFEVSNLPDILGLPDELHTATSNAIHQSFGIVERGVIVDDDDFHLLRARILVQDTAKRLLEIRPTVESRYENGPSGARKRVVDGGNDRAMTHRRPPVSTRTNLFA